MEKNHSKAGSAMGTPFQFEGKLPLKQAIPLGLQHVLAMFVGNLTPILIITADCYVSAALRDWTYRRKGSDHHGYQFRIHWSVPEYCEYYGWRCCCLWCYHGSQYDRRSFRDGTGCFLKATSPLFPVGCNRNGCTCHWSVFD